MPLKKLTLKAGVNKENTRYTNENGWYISDMLYWRQEIYERTIAFILDSGVATSCRQLKECRFHSEEVKL